MTEADEWAYAAVHGPHPTGPWWAVSAAANGVLLVAYTAIAVAITRGLLRSGQWRRNRLGVATAAIFVTCAVHHGSHTVHMLLPYAGVAVESGLTMRAAMGHGAALPVWDVLTAAVGIWYWGLRGRLPALVRGAAVFDDLRVRESSERALRASEERYRRIVETTSEGVLTTDPAGRVSYANRRFADLVGYDTGELTGRPVHELLPDADRAAVSGRLARRRAGRHERYDAVLRHRDGHDVQVEVAATPLVDAHGTFEGSLAMVTDVTEQRSLEAQFRQAQKLEAVGQLAGGVAHDFNNLLTVVDGYAALLLEDAGPGAHADVQAIRAAVTRAQGLTRQLLTFSRSQVTRPRSLDLDEVVTGIQDMLRRLISEDIELRVELGGHAGRLTVHGDRGQLEQVLLNLVVNARDAMPGGGTLTVRTGTAEVDAAQAQRYGTGPGPHAVLTVADTGTGMPPDVQAHVFEPFFTTKEPGKGTGLGLSTTYGIVREAGGHIAFTSRPGAGTTFAIHLPLVDGPADPVTAAGGPAELTAGRDETVLLVEDDPPVRELAVRILRTAGYRVLAAANAEQALAAAAAAEHVDLLLTDVVMPGRNGRELAELLVAARPRLKVLFTSGYARGIITARGILHEGVTYLEKPYTPAQLTGTVRRVLDGAPGGRPAGADPAVADA